MRLSLVISAVFALGGCLQDVTPATGGGPGGGNGSGGGGVNGAGGGDAPGGGGVPNPGCGSQTFPIVTAQTDPNVMLVVDESGSMTDLIAGTTEAKWDALKGAVTSLLSKYDGKVNWGLSIFPHPGGDQCLAGQVDIPVGAGTGPSILNMLAPLTVATIGGSTPTETTLQAVQQSGGLKDTAHNNYVLLMTDGLPTCGQDGKVTGVVTAMYNQAPSIRTFVVGIGDGTTSDPQQLNDWADAGHTARTGAATKFYQANDTAQLQGAFADILSGIASCTYHLASPPDDASLLVAYLDGVAVSTDPVNGMTYDAGSQSIVFHGVSCDKLKAGGATKVDVIYGCPSPPIQ